MECVIFDIETGPLPDSELEVLAPPFDRGKVRGVEILDQDFEPTPDSRLKDPQKIAQSIEQKRLKHAKEVEATIKRVEDSRLKHFEKFRDGAALCALTGQVLAIGYFNWKIKIDGRCEQDQLLKFWDVAKEAISRGDKMIGFNCFGFDLPFLARRSWLLGLSFPLSDLFDGRYWNRGFVDLMDVWKLGFGGETVSLDWLATGLKVGGKPEGITGKDFARLWEEDRNQAKAYLANDLKMTRACAERLGCLNV